MSNLHLQNPRWFAYVELVRLPNLFTAMADAAMGVLFVRTIDTGGGQLLLGLLMAASALLYAGGVVLNDLFDRPVDAEERPERPIPSGRVSPAAAAWLGAELLLLGAAVAWVAASLAGTLRPGLVALGLVGSVLLYDAWAKRTPLGPVVMGGCRMLNVLLGMSVAAMAWEGSHWLVAASIGLYIVGVTWFARTEADRSRRVSLVLATLVMLAGLALLAWLPAWTDRLIPALRQQPDRWQLLILLLGLLIGWRCLMAVFDPRPPLVQRAVKQGILSLVVLDAAVVFAVQGSFAAVLVLLLLVPAVLAGMWIQST